MTTYHHMHHAELSGQLFVLCFLPKNAKKHLPLLTSHAQSMARCSSKYEAKFHTIECEVESTSEREIPTRQRFMGDTDINTHLCIYSS